MAEATEDDGGAGEGEGERKKRPRGRWRVKERSGWFGRQRAPLGNPGAAMMMMMRDGDREEAGRFSPRQLIRSQ